MVGFTFGHTQTQTDIEEEWFTCLGSVLTPTERLPYGRCGINLLLPGFILFFESFGKPHLILLPASSCLDSGCQGEASSV